MTNGEVLQKTFPNSESDIDALSTKVVFTLEPRTSGQQLFVFDKDWWSAEYREPTTKNDSEIKEHKGEVMDFPNTFDEFADDYGFKDTKEVYTNGSELIQVYRVKQWLEHINEKTTMIDKSNFSQEQYKADLQSAYDCGYNQACKSKIAMPYATPDNCGNYIEQTTKNDLGVDKLIADCEKMSFDMEIFNKPLKVVALDAVKNIVKDLSSVTPQEPRKGHWIDEGIYADGQSYHSFMCSECEWHHIEHKNEIVDFNYCPNCGAEMTEQK